MNRKYLWAAAAIAIAAACTTREQDDDSDNTPIVRRDGGTNTSSDGGTPTDGATVVTVQQAVANTSVKWVSISNAVVIAEYHYTTSGGGVSGLFYIQDQGTAGPGLAVYKSGSSSAPFPAVGDIVKVSGHLSRYNGTLEISHSTKWSHPLTIEITGHNGTVAGGAYPPAGQPVAAGSTDAYAASNADNHKEQVGNVITFAGPLQVTETAALWETTELADGGTKRNPRGFEVTGGVLVDTDQVYYNCIKSLDGGVGALDLSAGITGVWDRYQDFNAGSAESPAPTVPVLVPMRCQDIGR